MTAVRPAGRWRLRDRVADGVIWLRTGLAARAVIVLAAAVALGASFGAGGVPYALVPLLLLLAAGVTAARPDTQLGLGFLLLFGWYWLVHVDRQTSPWTLLAAVALLVFHLATSAAAIGPPETDLPPPVLRAWGIGAAFVVAGTAVLWLVTVGFRQVDAGASIVLTAAALAVIAGAGWLALSRSGPSRP